MLRVLAASIGISEETTVAPVAVPALSSAFLQTCFYIAAQSQQPSRARVGGPRALRDGRVLRERPVDALQASSRRNSPRRSPPTGMQRLLNGEWELLLLSPASPDRPRQRRGFVYGCIVHFCLGVEGCNPCCYLLGLVTSFGQPPLILGVIRLSNSVLFTLMILPQVHLRKPCYDFYFL